MCAMCHVCGSDLKKLGSECQCPMCSRSFCGGCVESSLGLNGEDSVWCCKICSQKYSRELLSMEQDSSSPYGTPLISPAISLTSFESCASSCGEFLADANSQSREDADDEAMSTSQDHHNPESVGYLGVERGNLLKNVDITSDGMKNHSDYFDIAMPMEEIDKSSYRTTENLEDNTSEKLIPCDDTSKDVPVIRVDDDSAMTKNAIENKSQSSTSLEERVELSQPFVVNIDSRIWMPPEPENKEDDMECCVANNDDDDDYSDGTKWVQPCSLSSFGEEDGSNFRFKEERQKALVEVMNGHFRTIVQKLLTSKDISFTDEGAESWLNIVASLSWAAATLIKPDANEGMAMDPGCYLKVKCIASGSRSESQLIKGLVFKKNAAHKHMPTKYKNPRILLLKGTLGQRESGLSSFDSMEQEQDYVKSIIEMIEMCHPNVVLVEKTVSRDVQESLLAKGITLVFDMKLQRLERIARCTGLQIVSSSDSSINQKLKQCDSFYIQKFVEEYNSFREGGKRQSKTLMFFEGCPRPMGCTILLKGAHSDELKKVKCVVQHSVSVAYHLILETSFLVDQRARISNGDAPGVRNGLLLNGQLPFGGCDNSVNSNISNLGSSSSEIASKHAIDIPISDGLHEKSLCERISGSCFLDKEGNSLSGSNSHHDISSHENVLKKELPLHNTSNYSVFDHSETSHEQVASTVLPGQLFSSLSASLKRFLGDSFPVAPSSSCQSISTYLGFKEKELESPSSGAWPAPPSVETLDHETQAICTIDQGKSDGICNGEKADSVTASCEIPFEQHEAHATRKAQIPEKDDIRTILGPQSILVVLSSQCVSREMICKQCQLSRINYYGNSDMSLGRFLCNQLLNQKHHCLECGEHPEDHVYSYVHQNGKLTVLVKQLPSELLLPGETEGKLWMWNLCLKCEKENGIPKPTRRVVMSTEARGLSLGKFLHLYFSIHSASGRLSSCGHLLHRDCLHFYGLGSAVAMFGCSSVEIYTACLPPPVLEFNNPNGLEWLTSEAKEVLEKGNLLFAEIMDSLQKIESRVNSSLSKKLVNVTGSVREFSEIKKMLMQEKSDFEKAINKNGQLGRIVHQILGLNRLNHELLLELYIWDRRLNFLMSCTGVDDANHNGMHEKHLQSLKDDISVGRIEDGNALEYRVQNFEDYMHNACIKNEGSLSFDDLNHTRNLRKKASQPGTKLAEASISDENLNKDVEVSQPLSEYIPKPVCADSESLNSIDVERLIEEDLIAGESVSASNEQTTSSTHRGLQDLGENTSTIVSDSSGTLPLSDKVYQGELPISSNLQMDKALPNAAECLRLAESISTSCLKIEDMPAETVSKEPDSNLQNSLPFNLEDSDQWVWTPFTETRKAYRKDLQRGYSQKFEFINNYIPAHLSSVNQLITQEKSRLHFPVGSDDDVVSVYEDEFTSIIACALASLQDQYSLTENAVEKEPKKNTEGETEKQSGNSSSLPIDIAMPSLWSSSSSLDIEGFTSGRSVSYEDLSLSGSEAPLPVDPLHPEISLGVGKLPGKSKYSVVCTYAKQFYALRRRCCPCELDYISSLSRCKNWNAQGGKSKAFFAKTLDDRFIVKQIKKTEFESFLKFAPEYFKHISHSLSSGSQTCLAKILGVYQVVIRQAKNSKELKIDLVVMENLFFGRNVSRTYDLKGALHARHIADANDPEKVLLDQNFVDDMHISPFYVGGKTKHLLQRAIWNDTSFLTSINVMDYSLLVGIDKQRHELVFGIIDYLRQYTWDKHLETWVKASLVVPKNALPTVVSPREYKKRFRKFMSTYFLTVPDLWYCEQFSGPLKFCGDGRIDSSQLNNEDLTEGSNNLYA